MRPLRFLLLAILVGSAGGYTTVQARSGHHHHGRTRAHVGVYIGPPVGWNLQGWSYSAPYPYNPYAASPYYAYPPYYYPSSPTVIVVPQAPTGYIEQAPSDQGQRRQPAPLDWYYCRKPEGYYPYVKRCPGGWQRVPAQPPE